MSKYPEAKKFIPTNPQKYVGDVKNIIARSGLERRYMKYLDTNPSVIAWNSEELIIPYVNSVDRKVHRYFPDFLVKVKTADGEIRKFVVEVKPFSQTIPPKRGKKKAKTLLNESLTWEQNLSKWKAAEAFCKKHGMIFLKVTEKDIKVKY